MADVVLKPIINQLGCQIEISKNHLVRDLFTEEECEIPFLLVTKPSECEVLKSPDAESNTSKGSSLDGSPLKLTEYYVPKDTVTDSKTGVAYKACTIHEARLLLSKYQLKCQEDNVSHPVLPLWVLCDGNDPQNTAALSSHISKTKSNTYTIKSCVVTRTGPEAENDVTSKLNRLLKQYSHGSNQRIDVKCSAKFTIFGALGSKDTSVDQIQMASSTMNLHLTWNKLSMTLIPPRDARALVKVTVVAGDERSAAYSRYRELDVLLGLVRGVDAKEVHWTTECSDKTPLARVNKLLEDLKSGKTGLFSEDGEESESPAPVTLATVTRKDLDFTEELWTTLKDCTSNKDLIECFKQIFRCLTSNQIEPMVHRTNKTLLAELVRASFERKMMTPSLEGAGAVNILIDIGIEKLTRDYVNTFIGQELVTFNHLGPFLAAKKQLSYKERAAKLERLHYALELVVLLDQFINVPHPTLSLCARQALSYYEHNGVEPHHEFSIPLQTSAVSGYIENCKPCEHKVAVRSLHPRDDTYFVVHLCTQPSFPLVKATESVESTSEEEHYYLTTATQDTLTL